MWVEIVYSLSTTLTSLAISASSTDLKRIQTPHSLEFKLHTGRVQVWVRVWAPAGQLAISPEGYSSRQLRVWLQNQLPGSWGHSPAWTHMTSKHTKLPSQLQSWPACLGKKCCHSMILTTSGFLGNVLLWYHISLSTNDIMKNRMFCLKKIYHTINLWYYRYHNIMKLWYHESMISNHDNDYFYDVMHNDWLYCGPVNLLWCHDFIMISLYLRNHDFMIFEHLSIWYHEWVMHNIIDYCCFGTDFATLFTFCISRFSLPDSSSAIGFPTALLPVCCSANLCCVLLPTGFCYKVGFATLFGQCRCQQFFTSSCNEVLQHAQPHLSQQHEQLQDHLVLQHLLPCLLCQVLD